MLGHAALLALCLGIVGLDQPGLAQPRIVVASASDDAEDAERARAVADALVLGWQERGRAAQRPVPPEAEPVVDERETLGEAERAYAAMDLARAAELLDALLARVDASVGEGLDREGLLRALVLRALAAQALGDAEGAAAAVRRAVSIEPALVPDPARHPPALSALVDELREAQRPLTQCIAVSPPEARIELDARALEGPCTTLGPGRHYLRASLAGHVGVARVVELSEGVEPAPIELALRVDDEALLASGSADVTALRAAATRLGALLARVSVAREGEELLLTLEDGARVAHARTSEARFDARRMADALLASLEGAGGLDVPLVVGVSSAAALAVVAAIVVIVVLSAPQPSGFDVRAEILP